MKFSGLFLILAFASCSSGPGPFTPKSRVERQMVGLVQKFDRYDLNGDGELTARELKPAATVSGRPVSEILDFYDEDKDASISLKEAQGGFDRRDEARQRAKEGSM